jgi:hypothetical protein
MAQYPPRVRFLGKAEISLFLSLGPHRSGDGQGEPRAEKNEAAGRRGHREQAMRRKRAHLKHQLVFVSEGD